MGTLPSLPANSPYVAMKRALALANSSAFSDANGACLDIIQRNLDDEAALSLYVDTALQGQFPTDAYRALSRLQPALTPNPNITYYCALLLGQAAAILGRPEVARSRLGQLILETNARPFDRLPYYEIAGLYRGLGDDRRGTFARRLGDLIRLIFESGGTADLRSRLVGDQIRPAIAPGNDDWVVFHTSHVPGRVRKLASALRRAGRKVRLVLGVTAALEMDVSGFDDVVRTASVMDLVDLVDREGAAAYHVFATSDYGMIESVALLSLIPERTVIDIYDVSDPALSPVAYLESGSNLHTILTRAGILHRFMMNHAVGLCCRSLYNRIKRSYLPGARDRQIRIFCPELGSGHPVTRRKLSVDDGKLHVVYGGAFFVESAFGAKWAFMRWLAERAQELDIHFHLYGNPIGAQNTSEYEAIAARSPNFHLHKPHVDWVNDIAAFDIGLFYIYPDDRALLGRIPVAADQSRNWGNKFGDYLDAGLYMILPPSARLVEFVASRYGVGERISSPENIFERSFWDRIRRRVLDEGVDFTRARIALSREKQGSKLSAFYDRMTARQGGWSR